MSIAILLQKTHFHLITCNPYGLCRLHRIETNRCGFVPRYQYSFRSRIDCLSWCWSGRNRNLHLKTKLEQVNNIGAVRIIGVREGRSTSNLIEIN